MFRDKEIVIDREKNRYKKLFHLLGIIPMSDGWQKLPEIKSVALTKINMSQRLATGISVVNSSTIGKEFFVVYLYGEQKNIRVEVCKKKSYQLTKVLGEKLSKYFNVELVDYTIKAI